MEYTLRVGESAKIKRAFFSTSWSIVYAGMPNDATFSLVVMMSMGHNSAAYNLYFPVDAREFSLPTGSRVAVYSVSQNEIRIRCEK
jgi:hypothetical protein